MYTKKEMCQIISESAIYVDEDGSYRIDYVPEYELWESGEDELIMTDEETGEQISMAFDYIDLNRPEVLVYKLVLSNPIKD